MFKLLKPLLGVAAAVGFATSAQATVITFDSQLDGDGISTTLVGGATVVDWNDNTCGAYTACLGNGSIVIGSVGGKYAAPYVTASAKADDTPYLTVPLDTQDDPLSVVLLLPEMSNYFGLLWGSIDTYNTISFGIFDGGDVVASFTGPQVINPANGNQTAPSTNTYVNFFDLPYFNVVILESSNYAFESDNHAFANLPEPAALGFLGLGLVGLAMGRRRRRT